MKYETVTTEAAGGVLWITLNRPEKLNAFDEQMGADLLEALREGEKSAEARCLVLTGGSADGIPADVAVLTKPFQPAELKDAV
ncbi:MAG: enoyl-CoA hydratase/isomerase family protein, partial [Nitrososphaerota archaeon]|nr:enoyl-CoA hydratase/isomerase family protein [Nitrososphaerota archaeon]